MTKLIVAMDVNDRGRLNELEAALQGRPIWLKFGLEALSAFGYGVIEEAVAQGYEVFADVKYHDIPNTVGAASRVLARTGASLFNVHCSGGRAMCEAALKGSEEAAAVLGRPRPKVIGVTVLTSMGPAELASVGMAGSPGEAVLRLAGLAKEAGLDGVVCSVQEAAAIKGTCGGDFLTICPGIRPAGSDAGDQKRIATPRGAAEAGSDFIVVGRPITGAPDPCAACDAVLRELAQA
jgi:orotidine-5'-phosphate decarboxylase